MRAFVVPATVGALGGALVGALVWAYASRALGAQLREGRDQITAGLSAGGATLEQRLAAGERQLEAQVRDEVARAIDGNLRAYGVTPARMAAVWSAVDRAGLLAGRRR